MASIEGIINWFQARKGKVTYSMTNRLGPNSYDCSSAVFFALIEAGFLPKGTAIGNTESLYQLEGSLFTAINQAQAQRGDLFVAGVKGASGGSFGHTGVFTSNSTIIHCNGTDNGISETPVSGRTGSPVYFYRLKGINPGTKNGIAIDNVSNDIANKMVQWSKAKYYNLLTLNLVHADAAQDGKFTVVVECYNFQTLQYALNRVKLDLKVTEPGYIQSNIVHNKNSDGTYRIEIKNCVPDRATRVVNLLRKTLTLDTLVNILVNTITKSATTYGSYDVRIKGSGFNNVDTPIVVREVQAELAKDGIPAAHAKSFKY